MQFSDIFLKKNRRVIGLLKINERDEISRFWLIPKNQPFLVDSGKSAVFG
jgi:hypothetical protein